MTRLQRKQIKEAQKRMIDLDLTASDIAAALDTSPTMISQLVNGHYYYPRYADELFRKYKIFIPDTRELRRAAA